MVQRCEEKDTKHEDLRELLDAESFGAFPSGFTFLARLRERQTQRGSETLLLYRPYIVFTEEYGVGGASCKASYRSLVSIQHIFFCKESQTVFESHFT